MDEVFQAVDGGDFAFAPFVGASYNGDFVVFADGNGADLKHGDIDQMLLSDPETLAGKSITLCFSLSSLLRGALMIVRRTLEGAPKWTLRDLRLEEARPWTCQLHLDHFKSPI